MDAKQLVENFAQIQVKPFVAPVTPRTRKILIVQDGVSFVFRRGKSNLATGWHRFEERESDAIHTPAFYPTTEAEEWEIETYLEHLKPQFRLIVLYRLGEDTWLCYPWNLSDAVQKGWPLSEPRAVYLTRRSIEPFTCIVACGTPDNLIYKSLDTGIVHWNTLPLIDELMADPTISLKWITPETKTSISIVRSEIKRREEETKRKATDEQKRTLEGRIKYYLEFLGAKLVGWKEFGNNLEVTWDDGDISRKAIIDRRVNTVSAGICLSDRDSDFDLTSLVDVYREHQYRLGDDYDDNN